MIQFNSWNKVTEDTIVRKDSEFEKFVGLFVVIETYQSNIVDRIVVTILILPISSFVIESYHFVCLFVVIFDYIFNKVRFYMGYLDFNEKFFAITDTYVVF